VVEEIVRAIEQPISLARHDEVVLMQSFDLLGPSRPAPTSSDPKITPLRLLQFDVIVKDTKVASDTGWVPST
jgi:hypothetical protein